MLPAHLFPLSERISCRAKVPGRKKPVQTYRPYRFLDTDFEIRAAYTLTFAFFFGGFRTLMPRFFCHHTHRLGTKQMELNVPIAIPAIMGMEKLRMESRPITRDTMVTISIELNVVTDVRMLRRRD